MQWVSSGQHSSLIFVFPFVPVLFKGAVLTAEDKVICWDDDDTSVDEDITYNSHLEIRQVS